MKNELAESQHKRYEILKKNNCMQILKLERDKYAIRIGLDKSRNHIAAGLRSQGRLVQSESDKGWAANLRQARDSEAAYGAQLEKIRQDQCEALKRIKKVVDL